MDAETYTITTIEDEFSCERNVAELLPVLFGKGYTVYGVEHKPNQLVPYHVHPSQEIAIVLRGKMRYIIEEEIVDIGEGEVIHILASAVHATVSIADTGDSHLLITFV
ncbi:MAG: cupin domain-containing protein [Spirochaetota bacterium]